jgi:hypothetical protein
MQALATPLTDVHEVSYEIYPQLDTLAEHDRSRVSSAVATVSEALVSENPRYWSALTELAIGDKAAALALLDGKPVGFWVLERIEVDGQPGLYTVLTNVLPEYQGRHIAWELRTRFLLHDLEHDKRARFYTFRTRNPRSWQLNSRLCRSSVPDVFDKHRDAKLLELGRRAAIQLFPDRPLEFPSMVLTGVYPPMCCGSKEQHHRDSEIESAFFAVPSLANRENGRFFIGMLKSADEIWAMSTPAGQAFAASQRERKAASAA